VSRWPPSYCVLWRLCCPPACGHGRTPRSPRSRSGGATTASLSPSSAALWARAPERKSRPAAAGVVAAAAAVGPASLGRSWPNYWQIPGTRVSTCLLYCTVHCCKQISITLPSRMYSLLPWIMNVFSFTSTYRDNLTRYFISGFFKQSASPGRGGHLVRYLWWTISYGAWYRKVRYRIEEDSVRHYVAYKIELSTDLGY
jgi:hypothetical protein